jgi:hypothetical protein
MPRKTTGTLRQALDGYMRSRYQLAETTRQNDYSVLNRLVIGLGEDHQVCNLTSSQISD